MLLQLILIFSLLSNHIYSSFNFNDWIECEKFYISKNCPTQKNIIFTNSYTNVGLCSDVWHVIDMSDILPKKAKAINLAGLLIITHGLSEETADLLIYFRIEGNQESYLYSGQACEASIHNGIRSPISLWIPLSENKKFEFMWKRSTYGQYPENSAYGINLNLNAWAS